MSQQIVYVESPLLGRNRLDPLPEDFYPRMVANLLPFCGNEYDSCDYQSAIKFLNRNLNLKLDSREIQALGLLLTALSQANRFGNDVHIDPKLGENSAVHSCHTTLLVTELFRRAGLLDGDQQTDQVTRIRLEATMGALLHDMGEILIEFASLSQQAYTLNYQEQTILERKVFTCALRTAFWATSNERPEEFYRRINELRTLAKTLRSKGQGYDELSATLTTTTSEVLPSEAEASVKTFLSLYDLAEIDKDKGVPSHQAFVGYFIKATEHMQGTRHITRFCSKDAKYQRLAQFSPNSTPHPSDCAPGTIPLSLGTSVRAMKAARYNEGELGYLFQHAKTDVEKRIARTVADSMYQTIIEFLNVDNPLIDRFPASLSSTTVEMHNEIFASGISAIVREERLRVLERELTRQRKTLFERARQERSQDQLGTPAADRLWKIETRGRLQRLYDTAIKTQYEPSPGEILMKRETMPTWNKPKHS